MRWTLAIGASVLAFFFAAAVQGHQSRAAGLRGNPGQFFGPDAYPPEALRHREQGRVVARLAVDATGKVVDCRVTGSSGSTALDVRTCVIAVGKVKFEPARDDNGRPIASTYILPVRWVLPVLPPTPRQSTDELLTLTIGADDQLQSCVATLNDKPEAAPMELCGGGARVAGLRGRTGPGKLIFCLERIVQFPGARPFPEAHKRPGFTVLGLRRTTVDVAPDGEVGNQQIIEQAGPEGVPEPIGTLQPFEESAAPTTIEVLTAISFAVVR